MRCEDSQYSRCLSSSNSSSETLATDTARSGARPDRLIPRVNPIGLNLHISDFQKYSLVVYPKSPSYFPHPVPQRGVSGSSETRGGVRWTRQRQA
jgi:hypothetical protein